MDTNTGQILQYVGIFGFVLAFFQFGLGWFIGFLCTGVYFMIKKEDNKKKNGFSFGFGILAVLYSFYCLFTQNDLF